ncbi:Sjoegren syndrome nuclear autoantigen 1-like [Sceloporus undulatus]|uniref:Sjoegren syndrome nuclear autoantigen 1-like n=1 Tax=Sceloporus undulatus TaxID=8520 RepID=UPI001C4C097A|nr:Sjoegren syndrome nuclear autoantigen 1-like [Sceloporus undulatus]
MTHQGAVLQSYNNELVKFVEEMYLQREELNKQIQEEEEEKKKVQEELEMRTKELACVCEHLAWKITAQKELDKILAETELAYEKILESSRTLLNVLKTEMGNLDKMIEPKSTVVRDVHLLGVQSTQC